MPIDPKRIAAIREVLAITVPLADRSYPGYQTMGDGLLIEGARELLAEREELLRENERLRAAIANHVPHGKHPEDVHDFQCLACRILTWPFASSSRGGRSR